MDYRELDTNDYEVTIGEKSPNGIKQITITVKKDAPFCEECLSVEAVKKCVASRKVLDVVDKQPIQYTIAIDASSVAERLSARISMSLRCGLLRNSANSLLKKCCRII